METNAFASLAHLKIIIIPVGSISKPVFDKWATIIRTFQDIPLADIPPARHDDRSKLNVESVDLFIDISFLKARFMPPTPSVGSLYLNYTSHPPPIWHHSLALFRPSMFPVGVIGITACNSTTSLPLVQADFLRKVKHLYPYNSPYPLARSCFAFEDSDDALQLNAEESGIEVIPSVLGNKTSGHIGMLLAGFCSQILASFSSMVS